MCILLCKIYTFKCVDLLLIMWYNHPIPIRRPCMIIYKDVFEKMKRNGYSTALIRKEKLIPEGSLQNIREGKMVNLKTIDTICRLSGCGIEELIEYIPDENIHI